MIFIAALFGLIIGSFLNVLIDRLPKGQNVLWGRSRCDHCKRNLRWYELVPVASYVLQQGRCRRCRKTLSWQYPVVEVLTAAGFGVLYALTAPSFILYISVLTIFCSLTVIALADSKYQIIPDSMIISGFIGVLLWQLTLPVQTGLLPHLFSSVGASAFFYLLWRITKGRGMGFGDVKLAALLGFLLGYPGIIIALYIAFLTGAFVGVILILTGGKTLKSKIAFGPFMIFGTLGTLLFYHQIILVWKMFF